MTTTPLVAIVSLLAGAPPPDPCGLLQPGEIQALTPGNPIGAPVSHPANATGSVSCQYRWKAGKGARVDYDFTLSLGEASSMWPGADPTAMKEGFAVLAKTEPKITTLVAGVGDAATFSSRASLRADATALVDDKVVVVSFVGPDARGKKNEVIGLLRSAVRRLGGHGSP